MSATAQTGNYHLPIYEPGNLANYMVDWNGAMNTVDAALNVNHQDADRLKTDFENLETEFQQVKTESSGAATAATQAQEDAARAITIANNATTVAGDAQVDAHAALTQIQKLTTPNKNCNIISSTSTQIGNNPVGYFHLYDISTPLGYNLRGELIYASNPEKMPTKDWTLVPNQTLMYYSPSYVYDNVPYITTQSSLTGLYSFGNISILEQNVNEDWTTTVDAIFRPNVIAMGLYINNNKSYIALQFNPNVRKVYRSMLPAYTPNMPSLLKPLSLMDITPEFMSENAGRFIAL